MRSDGSVWRRRPHLSALSGAARQDEVGGRRRQTAALQVLFYVARAACDSALQTMPRNYEVRVVGFLKFFQIWDKKFREKKKKIRDL